MTLCMSVITIWGFDVGLPIISSQMPAAVDRYLEGQFQCFVVWEWEGLTAWPVIKLDFSETRKETTFATSSGWPSCPMAVFFTDFQDTT